MAASNTLSKLPWLSLRTGSCQRRTGCAAAMLLSRKRGGPQLTTIHLPLSFKRLHFQPPPPCRRLNFLPPLPPCRLSPRHPPARVQPGSHRSATPSTVSFQDREFPPGVVEAPQKTLDNIFRTGIFSTAYVCTICIYLLTYNWATHKVITVLFTY